MTIDRLTAIVGLEIDAVEEKSAIARDIKQTMDEMMWRSIGLKSTVLKQYELTLQQALALEAIVRLGPDVDMGRVSEATLLAPSTTTSVVDRLLQRGLVDRSQHPTDRRRVLVSATRNGEYLAKEMENQDLKSFLWLARDIASQDLRVIHGAFQHLLGEMESITVDDISPGGRFARKSKSSRA